MKIRRGFVSNSSSSSFVVDRIHEMDYLVYNNLKYKITEDQEKKLEEFGFIKSFKSHPSDCYDLKEIEDHYNNQLVKLDSDIDKEFASKLKKSYKWCYSVTCNQDDVIYFLITNKIPFIANVHYDHHTYFYTPNNDQLLIATNFGELYGMYKDVEDMKNIDPVRIEKASEYASKIKRWVNEYNSDQMSGM